MTTHDAEAIEALVNSAVQEAMAPIVAREEARQARHAQERAEAEAASQQAMAAESARARETYLRNHPTLAPAHLDYTDGQVRQLVDEMHGALGTQPGAPDPTRR